MKSPTKKQTGPVEIHVKHRPKTLDEVIGHPHVVSSLKSIIAKKFSRVFLFSSGIPGLGKTTMAHCVCREFGIKSKNILEVDGATNTGVDEMRSLLADLKMGTFDGSGRAIVLDEAHQLSKSAANSALKTFENPPAGVVIVLCTTEPNKLPATLRQRCQSFHLNRVASADIIKLLQKVAKAEGIKPVAGLLEFLGLEAEGSPRQALIWLAQTAHCKSLKDAEALVSSVGSESEIPAAVELFNIIGRAHWSHVQPILMKLRDENPEGVRRIALNWFQKRALETKNDNDAKMSLAILKAFAEPMDRQDFHRVLIAVGRIVLD
jgi:DNA polymerase III gamma/tau subunit